MDSNALVGGITRSGSDGSYTYTAKAGFENKPVTYVSFWDALRFANWLNNGQGGGDTETGAYAPLSAARPSRPSKTCPSCTRSSPPGTPAATSTAPG
jgi:hypothetical protein